MTHPRLIDPVDLPAYGLAVGLMFVQGAGYRVATDDGTSLRHMAPAAARRLAKTLGDGEEGAALAPVCEALCDAADKVDGLANAKVAGAA